MQGIGVRFAALIRWSKILFTPIAVAAVLYFAVANRETLHTIVQQGRWASMFLALLCWGGMNLLLPLVSSRLSAIRANHGLAYPDALRIHAVRLPARYLPGGIWHTAARVADYRSLGIDRRDLGAILVQEHLIALAITGGAGGAGIAMSATDEVQVAIGRLAALLGAATLAGLAAAVGKTRGAAGVNGLMQAVIVHFAAWMLAAFAFLAFIGGFPTLDLQYGALHIMASYLFAWAVGFLAFFSPQGVGVFELTVSELIVSEYPVIGVAVLMVGFRLVMLLGDAVVWLSFHLFRNMRQMGDTRA